MVVSAPRCTPPMPPVANTLMPAMWAMIIVVVTVVAPSFRGAQNSQIAAGGLGDGGALLAEVLNLLCGQTGLQTAADDGDGRGDGAVLADDALDLQSGLHILRIGHAVGDDGGLQSDDGLTGGNGLGDLARALRQETC